MDTNQSIQSEQANSLNFNNSSQVANLVQVENNPQFLSSISQHSPVDQNYDKEETSRHIAFNIFKPSDKFLFNQNSSLANIATYYKDLILSNYPNSSDFDFKIVLNIIKTYLNIDIVQDSEARFDDKECIIFKIPPVGSEIFILTQKDRFFVASAVKNYNLKISSKKRNDTNRKTVKQNYKLSEVSVRDSRGRHSTKTDIIFNKPELFDHISSSNPILPPRQLIESREEQNDDEGEVVIRDRSSIPKHVSEIIDSSEHIHYDMLYYTSNNPVKMLPWDGTHLGHFNKSEFEIVKTQTTLGNKFMLLNINGEQFWSECYKISDEENFSLLCAIDEWKPLFGLEKIGSHSIILDKKKYMLLKTPDLSKIFSISKNLSTINPRMVKGECLDQIRKILLFKYLIGSPLNLRQGGNFIKYNVETSTFSSHQDLNARASYGGLDLPKSIINKWLTDVIDNGRTDKDQYLIILSKYLNTIIGINNDEDKEIKPSLLRSKMENIGRRINSRGESNYCITFIISRVQYLIDL